MVKLGVQCLHSPFSLNTCISSEAVMRNALPMVLFQMFYFLQAALATFQDGLLTLLSDNSANKEETRRRAERILKTVTFPLLKIGRAHV